MHINNLDEFEKHLKENYPEMYENVYCGIYIDKGWFYLIDILSKKMYDTAKQSNVDYPRVVQIKEKFGGLRFYADNTDEYMNGLIDMAEKISIHVCEVCGNPGELRDTSWVRTLCDEHYVEHNSV
jgi:hypothetical protein